MQKFLHEKISTEIQNIFYRVLDILTHAHTYVCIYDILTYTIISGITHKILTVQ